MKSSTIYGTVNPIWNSRHYLCIRKRHLERKPDPFLTAVVFCRDAHDTDRSVVEAISNHAHLGVGSVSFDQCKEPGVHEFETELMHPTMNRSKPATVSFKVEFITVEKALKELGKEDKSGVWMEPIAPAERSHMWCQLAWMTEVGDIELTQLAHVVSASKLTKVAYMLLPVDMTVFSGLD